MDVSSICISHLVSIYDRDIFEDDAVTFTEYERDVSFLEI